MPWTKARSRFCVAFEEDETSEPAKEDLEDVLWMTPESSHTIREKDYFRLGIKIDPILYWLYFSFTRQYCSKVRFFCSMKYLQRNASKFAIFFWNTKTHVCFFSFSQRPVYYKSEYNKPVYSNIWICPIFLRHIFFTCRSFCVKILIRGFFFFLYNGAFTSKWGCGLRRRKKAVHYRKKINSISINWAYTQSGTYWLFLHITVLEQIINHFNSKIKSYLTLLCHIKRK